MDLSRKNSIILLIIIATGLIAFAWFGYRLLPQQKKQATITFLDVGQGDATLLQTPQGEQMLVDCGRGPQVLSALGRTMPFFDRTIEHLVVTHPDTDHYAGCIDVLQRYHVLRASYNGIEKAEDPAWQAFTRALQKEQLSLSPITTTTVWYLDRITITSLFPAIDLRTEQNIFGSKTGDNNLSVVLRATAAGRSYLLIGDAEKEQEEHLVETYGSRLQSSVLKVGHHGSKTSSSELFLKMAAPEIAIISASKNNRYGHPHQITLSRLRRFNMQIRRTDIEGDISFVLY